MFPNISYMFNLSFFFWLSRHFLLFLWITFLIFSDIQFRFMSYFTAETPVHWSEQKHICHSEKSISSFDTKAFQELLRTCTLAK